MISTNSFFYILFASKVLENFEARGSNSESMVHVINMNVIDNPEVSSIIHNSLFLLACVMYLLKFFVLSVNKFV
jgi:hypothetical protein